MKNDMSYGKPQVSVKSLQTTECFQKGLPTFVSAKATVPSSSVERSSSFW